MTESESEKIARLEQMLKTQNSELENFKKTVNDLRASGPSGPGGSGNSIIVRQDSMVKYPIPRLEENMTWDEYKASVETWKDMCEIEPSKQGPLLISGLPVKGDQVGGIQRLVYNNVKATLKTATGADDIVKEIKRIMLKPDYCRLIDWVDNLVSARQRSNWVMERWIAEVNGYVKKAKDEFNMTISPMLHVGLLVRGVTSIDQSMLPAMLKDIDMEDGDSQADLVKNTEIALRKYALPSGSKRVQGVKVNFGQQYEEKDIFGQTIKKRKTSSEDLLDDEFSQEEERAFYGHGGRGGHAGRGGRRGRGASKSVNKSRREERESEWEREKERCREMNLCFRCKSSEHRLDQCPTKRAEMLEKKKETLRKGIPWKNRDNTWTMPDGSVSQTDPNAQPTLGQRQFYCQEERSLGVTRKRKYEYGNQFSMPEEDILVFDEENDVNPHQVENLEGEKSEHDLMDDIDGLTGQDTRNVMISDNDPVLAQAATERDEHEEVEASSIKITDIVNSDRVLVASHGATEAIIDTGCTKCCAGSEWTEKYLQTLSEKDLQDVVKTEGKNKFKFGDDSVYSSVGYVAAPVYIGGKRKILGWDQVNTTIPLLISRRVLQRLGMTLSFRENNSTVARFAGVEVELNLRDGHDWIDISAQSSEHENAENILFSALKNNKSPLNFEEVVKLHEQMSHPPMEKMKRTIMRASRWNQGTAEFLQRCYSECLSKDCRARLHCQKIGKIGTRMPERVGDMVCADLKIAGKNSHDKDILYIVDMFSNLVIADVISNKQPGQIVDKFLEHWFSKGMPRIKTLITDCGTEFLGHDMAQFLQSMNIKHVTTVPRSPQMNGQCERVHAIIDGNASRLRENRDSLSQRQALAWACYAWNMEEKRHGYAPADLVFGPCDRETNFLDLSPVELQDRDMKANIVEQLQAREQARIEHLSLKASDKVRDALYRKTVPTRDRKELGTWVWMKRSLEKDWRGPGQISDSLHSGCSVKIGNQYFSARHEDCLPLTAKEMEMENIIENQQVEPLQHEYTEPAEIETREVISITSRDDREQVNEINDLSVSRRRVRFNDDVVVAQEPVVPEVVQQVPEGVQQVQPPVTAAAGRPRKKGAGNFSKTKNKPPFYSPLGFHQKETVEVLSVDRNEWIEAAVVDRHYPTKADTGSEWYRLRFDPKNPRSDGIYDMRTIDWRRPTEVSEVNKVYVAIVPPHQHNTQLVKQAKAKELETLRQFETFEDRDLRDLSTEQKRKIIPSTWNVVLKDVNDKESVKARLCARGDKEVGVAKSDSPTVTRQALRLLLTMAASRKQKVFSLDFKGAYLQGQLLDREVYMSPPSDMRESNPNLVWKVRKRLYGFRDSARGWFLEFNQTMIDLGCEPILVDAAMYTYKDEKNNVIGMAGVHVDDVLYAGTPRFHSEVMDKMLEKYVIGRVERDFFTYTGWTLRQDDSGITLTQGKFLDQVELDKYQVFRDLRGDDKEMLNEQLQALYRSLVGSLQWIVSVSRPDKAYHAVALASKLGKANIADAKLGVKQLDKTVKDPQEIKFSALQDISSCQIRAYCDSSWGKLHGCETVNANVSFIVDKAGNANVIDWQAKKMDIPAASPLTGEAMAALDTFGKIPWIRSMLSDMTGVERMAATLVTDSKSLEETVSSCTSIRDKRAMVAVCTARRMPLKENVKIQWCRSGSQLADVLTKPGVNSGVLREVLSKGKLTPSHLSIEEPGIRQ